MTTVSHRRPNPKVMVVTGGSGALGGFLLGYYRRAYPWVEVFDASRSTGCDVSDESSVVKFIDDIVHKCGHIDYLVNNAGFASMNHALLTTGKSFSACLDVNLLGAFLMSRECFRGMHKSPSGRGSIVNIGTVAEKMALPGECGYVASKAGLLAMTKVLASEFWPVANVNYVGPGPVATDGGLLRGVSQDKISGVLQRQPVHEMTKPMEVAAVVDFFIQNHFVTGQSVYLGGV